MADEKKVIYSMVGVGKKHNHKVILKDIYLSYFYGAKIGVLGLNGSGKSTLLKILAGVDKDFHGETVISEGFSVGYLEQEPVLDPEKTVRQVVEEGVSEVISLLEEYEKINMKFGESMDDNEMNALLERQGLIQDNIDILDGWEIDNLLERAMDALRCPQKEMKIKTLSGGERRRVALCQLLLKKPDILLLDEPTNHLDAESVYWLEQHLRQYAGTIIAVTHDRYFLDNVAGWILELDRGEGIPWKGNYSSWLEQKKNRLANEKKQEGSRQKMLLQELNWIHTSKKGGHSKGKSRINSYESLRDKDTAERAKELQIYIPSGPRLGNVVIRAEGVSKSFGENILYDNLNFDLPKGAIVGIVGANGAGKTTLFKMITEQESPDTGSFIVGETVKLIYVDQLRDLLDSDRSVWEMISGGQEVINFGKKEMNSRAYVSQFNFIGGDQQKKVGNLSGGERNRVNLAMMLKEEANVLLLDEPTNDLDVNTIRALESGLEYYGGCAVVISHDRWFLDRVATHILAFEGDSKSFWFEGNWSEYEEDRKRRLGDLAKQPHRIKYRKLVRG